jgi:phage tail tape-measure protein
MPTIGDQQDQPTDHDQAAERTEGPLGELTEGGIELAGALAGGALGLIGGPAGVLGGATLGVALTRGSRWRSAA